LAIALGLAVAHGIGVAAQEPRPKGVVVVPMGTVQADLIDTVSRRVGERWSIPIEVRPRVALDPSLIDARRRQVIAERSLAWLEARFAPEASDRIVIGVVGEDLYIAGRSWRYAFSLRKRRSPAPGLAIMSIARMSEAFYGHPEDRTVLASRFGKMLTKNVGVLYFGLPLSEDPRSVMFDDVMGPDDLDRMGDALPQTQGRRP
jgi:predicted Zn-dependent protease